MTYAEIGHISGIRSSKGGQAMRITISASYNCVATGSVDLSPKKWSDVKDWYIKWDTLHVQFEGDESWVEFGIGSDSSVDWKRPVDVDIYEGEFEFDVELASQ